MKKTALVITSIAGDDSPVLATYAAECRKKNIPFIVIGDTKSPPTFSLEGCDFLSLEKQAALGFKLAPILPVGHYARKNLGYLLARQNGATRIVETDDDNYPKQTFWQTIDRSRSVQVRTMRNVGWVNVYHYFTESKIWPRGFPLEELQKNPSDLSNYREEQLICPIQQGLADDNPDVDAVYRLTYPLPLKFHTDIQMALGENAWSPFNSQNTHWFKEAMPLMYLPSYCSFRMTDIWRSFIAQRIAWVNDWSVLYYEPTVWQERNEHDLLKDFAQEIPGYLNNNRIVTVLSEIDLKKGTSALCDNLIKCYDAMMANGWVQKEEAPLIRAWSEDISNLA